MRAVSTRDVEIRRLMMRRVAAPSFVLIAFLTQATACGDRPPAAVGIAMGGDTATPMAILTARQQRFNDSVGPRHQVKLYYRTATQDSALNPALAWANDLTRTPGLVGVVGHESSRMSLQAAPIYRQHGVVQIVPTGTSSQLASVSPWTFPLVASDASQGLLLAQYLVGSGRKRITLFVQDDEYGRGIVESVKRALNGTDIQILENVMHTPASDYELLVRSMLSHDPRPDALMLITQGPIATTVAQLAWRRDSTLLILASDAASTGANELRTLVPTTGRLVMATYWLADSTNKATQEFLRDYRSANLQGEPQWYHAALYDAVGLLNSAAAEAGADPSDVRSWMLSLGRDRPAYAGVLGEIDFTGKHAIAARLVSPSPTGWELVK